MLGDGKLLNCSRPRFFAQAPDLLVQRVGLTHLIEDRQGSFVTILGAAPVKLGGLRRTENPPWSINLGGANWALAAVPRSGCHLGTRPSHAFET
jgi:hypothetical protein